MCGPTGKTVYKPVAVSIAEDICREVLRQPDRRAAERYLKDVLRTLDTPTPGLRIKGSLSDYQLTPSLRKAEERDGLDDNGDGLLQSLGFDVGPYQTTRILRTAGQKVAVAVLLDPAESPDQARDRGELSPVSKGLLVAHREKVSYVLIQQRTTLRLYHVVPGVGGSQRDPDTYIQIFTGLLPHADATFGYLRLIFSAEALLAGGTLERLL